MRNQQPLFSYQNSLLLKFFLYIESISLMELILLALLLLLMVLLLIELPLFLFYPFLGVTFLGLSGVLTILGLFFPTFALLIVSGYFKSNLDSIYLGASIGTGCTSNLNEDLLLNLSLEEFCILGLESNIFLLDSLDKYAWFS